MSNTHDRTSINRENSKLSTGPRTEAGKQRSSLNALRHGLTGHTIILPSEDLKAYERHAHDFFDEYQPKGATEKQLVQTIADTTWRLNRITALENNLLALGLTGTGDEIETALAQAAALAEQARALSSLSIHENRLSRQFERTLKQLREIQSARREAEKTELYNAAELLEMHKAQGLPYNPADDGFVFSNDEIETYARRRDRLSEAEAA